MGLNGLGLGARCPGGQGPEAARRPASRRNRAASGPAEAKWMRMRAAFFDHAGADLEQAFPEGRELGPGERHPAGHGIAQGEHQPVGRGVQDEAELVGGHCQTNLDRTCRPAVEGPQAAS